ncbi:MAG: DUF4230 domain-containing protein [Lachnospiraceae bacterium]|nr:DUF4230 domain-containing protein [Lachnospiraceae bacterium]
MKQKNLKILCVVLSIAIVVILIWGHYNRELAAREAYSDGIEQIDIDTIYLGKSGVQVEFSDVIVGTHQETRKLIVSTQEATVSTELTDRLIKPLDFDFMKKTQKVNYTGTGYFVVDLDNLTKDNVIQDKDHKIITIQIDHAYLQAIEIDPNKIIIDEVKESLLARGDIELTLKDYNAIEKELRNRLEAKFDTAENGQEADTIALQMVKDVYEPIIKAIDASYELYVEFK